MIPHNSFLWQDIFQIAKKYFENDKPAFLSLLENHIDIDELFRFPFLEIIFYALGRKSRKYLTCNALGTDFQVFLNPYRPAFF